MQRREGRNGWRVAYIPQSFIASRTLSPWIDWTEERQTDGQEERWQSRQVDMYIVPLTRLQMHNAPVAEDDFDGWARVSAGRTTLCACCELLNCSSINTVHFNYRLKFHIKLLNSSVIIDDNETRRQKN
jgi:hypothetical protein